MQILNDWIVQAAIIAIIASIILNGASHLPFFRDIKPRRIEARWVGYVGLTSAFGFWLALGPQRPAWQAVAAWVIIMLSTLLPNTILHWHDRDTKSIRLLLTEEGEALLERWLRDHAPDDPELQRRFMTEQAKETAEERWLNAIGSWAGMLGEFDDVLACLVQALKQESKREPWVLSAIAGLTEMRESACKTRAMLHVWYKMFWPECAAE